MPDPGTVASSLPWAVRSRAGSATNAAGRMCSGSCAAAAARAHTSSRGRRPSTCRATSTPTARTATAPTAQRGLRGGLSGEPTRVGWRPLAAIRAAASTLRQRRRLPGTQSLLQRRARGLGSNATALGLVDLHRLTYSSVSGISRYEHIVAAPRHAGEPAPVHPRGRRSRPARRAVLRRGGHLGFRVELAGPEVDIASLVDKPSLLRVEGIDTPRLVHGILSEFEYVGHTRSLELYEVKTKGGPMVKIVC